MSTTLAEVILSHIYAERETIFTAIPATIVDASKLSLNVVSVKPSVNRVDSEGKAYEHPILADQPIIWPSGGGGVLTFPLAIGDDVLVVFAMRSTDELLISEDGNSSPFDARLHDISDAFIIPSFSRVPNAPIVDTANVNLSFGDADYKILPDGSHAFTNAVSSVVYSANGDILIVNDTTGIQATNAGVITLANTVGTVTLAANGDLNFTNDNVIVDAFNTGGVDISNATGNFTMAVNGDVDINGAQIDAATGNVVTALGADLDALQAAYDIHIHADPVSGNTGGPIAPP